MAGFSLCYFAMLLTVNQAPFGRMEGVVKHLMDEEKLERSKTERRVFFFTYADKSNTNLCRYRKILRAFGAELLILGGGAERNNDAKAIIRDTELLIQMQKYQHLWQGAHKGFGLMNKVFSMLALLKNRTKDGRTFFLPGSIS